MGRGKAEEHNVRVITKNGTGSYSITIPIQFIRQLRWQERQRVTVSLRGGKLVVQDWDRK